MDQPYSAETIRFLLQELEGKLAGLLKDWDNAQKENYFGDANSDPAFHEMNQSMDKIKRTLKQYKAQTYIPPADTAYSVWVSRVASLFYTDSNQLGSKPRKVVSMDKVTQLREDMDLVEDYILTTCQRRSDVEPEIRKMAFGSDRHSNRAKPPSTCRTAPLQGKDLMWDLWGRRQDEFEQNGLDRQKVLGEFARKVLVLVDVVDGIPNDDNPLRKPVAKELVNRTRKVNIVLSILPWNTRRDEDKIWEILKLMDRIILDVHKIAWAFRISLGLMEFFSSEVFLIQQSLDKVMSVCEGVSAQQLVLPYYALFDREETFGHNDANLQIPYNPLARQYQETGTMNMVNANAASGSSQTASWVDDVNAVMREHAIAAAAKANQKLSDFKLKNDTYDLTIDIVESIFVRQGLQEIDVYGGLWYDRRGYGTIHTVNRRDSNAKLAMKTINEPLNGNDQIQLKRLIRETLVWAQLDHPKIMPLIGYTVRGAGRSREIGLLSEFQENGNLLKLLKDNPNTRLADRIKFLMDVSEALAYMHGHAKRIAHGDIKADNVLISRNGGALLCDFGISKYRDMGSKVVTGMTTCIAFLPFELFMSHPMYERATKKGPTPQGDVFAFGLLMLHVLTGTIPYDKSSEVDIVDSKSKFRNPYIPPNVGEKFRILMLRCWQVNPLDRPPAQEIYQILSQMYGKYQTA